MPSQDPTQTIAELKKKAEEHYRDFLRAMDALEEERKKLFQDAFRELDEEQIKAVRAKYGILKQN